MSFTHVQGAGATTSANVLTLSMTLGAAPTAGNVVCVGLNITYSGATAPTGLTIKDDAGHSYVITPNSPEGQVDDAGAFSGPVWLAYLFPIPSGASATITATWASTTGTAGVQLFADEFSPTTPMSFDKDIAAIGTTAG